MTASPVMLDLFCCAGGLSVGYARAGFRVIGVDIEPQPHYPYEFHQSDAFDFFGKHWRKFDAASGSPPCQGYSRTNSLHNNDHPKLIEPVRKMFMESGLPYVIENVVGAPLICPILLCGSMFGLGVWRHRQFESNVMMFGPYCNHDAVPLPIDVTGTGGPCEVRNTPGGGFHRKPRNLAHAREVMGIDWMTRRELSQAIPPMYGEYVGKQLQEAI